MSFTVILFLVLYYVVVIGIGYWALRRGGGESLEDYLLGGRQVGPLTTALTLQSTSMSGYMFLGAGGLGFVQGYWALWFAAGDISGKLPLSSVASVQGRKVAEHVMGLHTRSHRHLDYDKAASAIFTEPEIADVGLAEAEAFSSGRKIRVTKVPFSATAKAMINADTRGFVKIISDPNTGVVLGGSIVGRHAAELISVIAVAVTAHLTVTDLVESILVHPALSEALAEAAD